MAVLSTTPLRIRLKAWWRHRYGTPPSWHFTSAHYAALMNDTSIEDEVEKERLRRADAIKRWEQGL